MIIHCDARMPKGQDGDKPFVKPNTPKTNEASQFLNKEKQMISFKKKSEITTPPLLVIQRMSS